MLVGEYEVEVFEGARARLEAVAYRLLGSANDAEDVVQDTFLRWQSADRELIETPEAWLTKVLTNICLNRPVRQPRPPRRHHAVGDPDDQPKPSAVTGGMAVRIKELICKIAAWSVSHPTSMLPTRRHHTTLAEERHVTRH